MIIREALPADIPQIQVVRNSVRENTLSNPELVSDADCLDYIDRRGKGWVCELDEKIIGFSIVDLQDNNVWALIIHPDFEKRGIGKQLHDIMIAWYFSQTDKTIWLGTSPGTRAEQFYQKAGWRKNGLHGEEVRFEMDLDHCKQR